jgi:hypothetical protein
MDVPLYEDFKMLIYLVTEGEPYEGSSVIAVYSKKENAEKRIDELIENGDGYIEYGYDEFRVLDMPGTIIDRK